MAYTTIHPIKSTLNYAITYICNPHKTEEQKYSESYACSLLYSTKEFLQTQARFDYGGEQLAFHLIQSFAPGEATPEQAHEIGLKLAEKLLKGRYEYVLTTHLDKHHIHNHIMINSVSFETGKTFSTEHDRFNNPAWKKIRNISDDLCKDYGLSVISNPERGKGKSHYEWEQGNSSWKSKLKNNIDECIQNASDFDDFLKQMRDKGYEIKQGKYISFRAPEQERFTRTKTLGYYYQEEQLKYRIERRNLYKAVHQKPNINIHRDSGGFIQIDETQPEGLKRWAMVQNMKKTSEILNQLAEHNVTSIVNLNEKIIDNYDNEYTARHAIIDTESEMTQLALNLKNLHTYREMKPINERYKAAKNKERFLHEHESELIQYGIAKAACKDLLNDDGKLPSTIILEKQYEKLSEKRQELIEKHKAIKKELQQLEKLKTKIDTMKTQEKTAERQDDNLE